MFGCPHMRYGMYFRLSPLMAFYLTLPISLQDLKGPIRTKYKPSPISYMPDEIHKAKGGPIPFIQVPATFSLAARPPQLPPPFALTR